MNYDDTARLLGIKISHTTASSRGEYWQLETPASIMPSPFSKQGPAIYELRNKEEVEAFIWGYSLAVRYILQVEHTPQ
jgi:hypothetical protein